jgi:hypothetical protein
MTPFEDVWRVVAGELSLEDWRSRCRAMGVAGRLLGPQQSASTA